MGAYDEKEAHAKAIQHLSSAQLDSLACLDLVDIKPEADHSFEFQIQTGV